VLLLCLVALSVVLLVTVVGVVLVVALLTLPAAAAGRGARSLRQMMAVASLIGLLCVGGGLVLSFPANLPAGPLIVLLVAGAYLLAWAGGARRRKG
jgi:zinc transport system permease protein